MNSLVLITSLTIQLLVIIMTLYLFKKISQEPKEDLGVLTKYYVMRQRYERLRMSLVVIVLLIIPQAIGIGYLIINPEGPITMTQILLSNIVLVIVVIFLTQIYRSRSLLRFDDHVKK